LPYLRLTGPVKSGPEMDLQGSVAGEIRGPLSTLTELHGGRLWSEPLTSGDGASVKVFLPAEPTKS